MITCGLRRERRTTTLCKPERPRACHWRGGDRPQAHVTLVAYTKTMDTWKNPNEDERGVDVGQIRDMLSMSVAQRAHEMVRVANLMAKARETAREARLKTR